MKMELDRSTTEELPMEWTQLVVWACEDTDESWAKIDAVIGSIANDEKYILHAVNDLKSDNQNIRDLSASILETTRFELADETIISLKEMLSDEHFYARFRAACALVKHLAYGKRIADVKRILRNALTDDDQEVVAIAQHYLGKLG